jgi:hypothetical protein
MPRRPWPANWVGEEEITRTCKVISTEKSLKLPPARECQVYHAGQGQGKRAPTHRPRHLHGLDLAWSGVLNPRGSRGRVAGTADGRQGQTRGEGSRSAERMNAGTVSRLQQEGLPFPAPLPLGTWFVRSSLPTHTHRQSEQVRGNHAEQPLACSGKDDASSVPDRENLVVPQHRGLIFACAERILEVQHMKEAVLLPSCKLKSEPLPPF